jgi:hypothetical protein
MINSLMWQRYRYRGHEVVVIQQWSDPFGTPMVRIADADDDAAATGLTEAAFMTEAQAITD